MELADQLATADEPDVRIARGLDHLRVHGRDVSLHEPEVDPGNRPRLAVREDPHGRSAYVACQRSGCSSSCSWSSTHW